MCDSSGLALGRRLVAERIRLARALPRIVVCCRAGLALPSAGEYVTSACCIVREACKWA